MIIREFNPTKGEFEQFMECYRAGFPEGYDRYWMSRTVRIHRDTVFVAEDNSRIVGVVVGICSSREAWMTSLAVVRDEKYGFAKTTLRLLRTLGTRFQELGFKEAFATTGRPSVVQFANSVGATLIGLEKDYYFDDEDRYIFKGSTGSLENLGRLIR